MNDQHRDEPRSDSSNVPGLIKDYRAQWDAWRAQARDLARLREQVLSAADREARDIVAEARTEVRHIVTRARQKLLLLAAQVQAATDTPQISDPALPGRDDMLRPKTEELNQARETIAWARRDVRGVLNDAKPEFASLANEVSALRDVINQTTEAPDQPVVERHSKIFQEFVSPKATETLFDSEKPERSQTDTDRTFTSTAIPASRGRMPASIGASVAMSVLVGVPLIGGSAWWLLQRDDPAQVGQTPAISQPAAAPAASASPAAAPAAARPRTASGVSIEAQRSVWMRTTVDGEVVAARMFAAGERQEIPAGKEVVIRAGDAGAVMVSVNGAEPAVLGTSGQVVTRRFTLGRPAASAVATPVTTGGERSPDMAAGVERELAGRSVVDAEAPAAAPIPLPPAPSTPRETSTRESPAAGSPAGALAAATPNVPPSSETPVATPAARPPNSTPAAAAAPAPGGESVRSAIAGAAEKWLEAYYRQDQQTMSVIGGAATTVSDQRTENERLPRGQAGLKRNLEDVTLQVFGDNALFTARMTEQLNAATGRTTTMTSYVSQMWARRGTSWQLDNVRIVDAAALNRTVR